MMKAIAAIAAVALSTVNAAAQTSPFPFWVGAAVIDSVTPACKNGGFINKNDLVNTDYRAKTGTTGEPKSPGITFTFPRAALALFRTGGAANANTMDGNGNYGGYLIRANVTTIPNPNQQPHAGAFSFDVTPAAVTKTTDVVTINGTINNWRAVAGCTVKFRAAYRQGN
jgi:hypothetical protein